MDIRLVPLALGMWLSSATTIYASGRINPVSIIVLLAVAVTSLVLLRQIQFRAAVVLAFVGVLVGLSVALIRTIPLHNHILSEAINDERIVTITGFVVTDPIEFERKQALDWVTQSAAVLEISSRTMQVADKQAKLRLPMSIFSTQQSVKSFESLIPGTYVQVTGKMSMPNPGRKYAATVNAHEIMTLRSPPKYQIATSHLRAGLHAALARRPIVAQGLVPGLALGDSSALDAKTKQDMRAAGLTHLVAVSGANVALLLGLLHRFTYRFSMRIQFVLSVIALGSYVVLVRPQPSVVRAATMAVVVLMALTSRWKVHALPALCTAVIVLIALDPWLSTSYGFVLSVLATAGLITAAVRMQQSFERTVHLGIPRWVLALIAVTTAAQLAVLPVVVGLGSQISLASIPANVLAVPLATPAMFSGLVAAIVAVMWLPAAQLLVLPGVWAAQAIALIAKHTADASALTVTFPAGIVGVVCAALVVGAISHTWKQWHSANSSQREMIATIIVVASFLVWWRPDLTVSNWPSANWTFVMCDVGQGDALVLRTGKYSAIVIDTGTDALLIDRCLHQLHVKEISILILTHFHADHVGGIEGVYRNRSVARVWVTALQEPELTTAFALAGIQKSKIEPEVITQLHHEIVGPIDLQIVWPARIIRGQGSDPNNSSIAILATVGSHCFFLAGDLEPAAQRAILDSWPIVAVDYLKVAHHGSAHQLPEFIERLHPKEAFISVGKVNDYGHPAMETLSLLNALGARVWRTDKVGSIAVVATEKSWLIQTAR